jgi:hypothetical protein
MRKAMKRVLGLGAAALMAVSMSACQAQPGVAFTLGDRTITEARLQEVTDELNAFVQWQSPTSEGGIPAEVTAFYWCYQWTLADLVETASVGDLFTGVNLEFYLEPTPQGFLDLMAAFGMEDAKVAEIRQMDMSVDTLTVLAGANAASELGALADIAAQLGLSADAVAESGAKVTVNHRFGTWSPDEAMLRGVVTGESVSQYPWAAPYATEAAEDVVIEQ